MKKIDERILGDEVFLAEKYRPREFALVDVTADRGDVLVKEFSDLAGCMEVEVDGHWIKFSIGIPVFWEIRIAVLVPKVLFPLKKYDKYASVIPSSFANSLRDKLFFFIYSRRCLAFNFFLKIYFNNILLFIIRN